MVREESAVSEGLYAKVDISTYQLSYGELSWVDGARIHVAHGNGIRNLIGELKLGDAVVWEDAGRDSHVVDPVEWMLHDSISEESLLAAKLAWLRASSDGIEEW